jgi:undecaprenyl-phosphate galactose phosphotransferase
MVKYFNRRAAIVLSIRPGLTGLWQVSGRSNVSYEERIRLDEEYVKTQSFWLDLKLIAKTLPAILTSRGAY